MQLASAAAELVQRFLPAATRQDLVLPRESLRVMDRMVLEWCAKTQAPAALPPHALGAVSALFVGPSGTGKSLAGEVLANEARQAFYSVDLGRVVDQYGPETQEVLAGLFERAQSAGALLYLDEADALLGKRSEVADGHDRFAHCDKTGLLQRVENYRGIVILASKMKTNLDSAFTRRIRYLVEFPLPDAAQRLAIWQRIFPPDTPVECLDTERLARLPVSGATIRNIARLSAALAAGEGQPVRMAHLLRAAETECARVGGAFDPAVLAQP
jgi:SpoVK/Ycf46/Vps4 family AAA+-type ATPase